MQLSCIGEGPVVHVTPETLDWGHTEVLTPNVKMVKLSNQSTIPADFIAQMVRQLTIAKLCLLKLFGTTIAKFAI